MVMERKPEPAVKPGGPGITRARVELAPAPRRPFRRSSLTALILGVLLLVAGGLWMVFAPGALVKYDTSDQTLKSDGQFTMYVDPATGLMLQSPQVAPLHVEQLIHVVRFDGNNAVVSEKDTQVIAGQTNTIEQQYLIDRSTLQNVKGDASWAYSPGNVVDRSSNYTINLPFATGAGPYNIWMNEAGRAYSFSQQGDAFTNDGVNVLRFHGTMAGAPVPAYYIATLQPSGITATTTLDKLKPQLKAVGLDVDALFAALLPVLSPQEAAGLQAAASQPIPLAYSMSADTTILVEQRTGAIVAVEKQSQTLSVKPDATAMAPLATLLARHTDVPAVQQALPVLTAMGAAPATNVYNASFAQSAASVQQISDYVKGRGDSIDLVKMWLPIAFFVAGGVLVIVGGGLWFMGRRRQQI